MKYPPTKDVYASVPIIIGHFEISERLTKTMMDMNTRKIRTTKSNPWKMGIRKINEKMTVSRKRYKPTTRYANCLPNTLGAYRKNMAAVRAIEMAKVGTIPKKRSCM